MSAEDAEHPFQVSYRITGKCFPGSERTGHPPLSAPSDALRASSCLHGDEIYSAKECHRGIHSETDGQKGHVQRGLEVPREHALQSSSELPQSRGCCRSQQMETSTHARLIAEPSLPNPTVLFSVHRQGVYSSIHLECDFFLFPPGLIKLQLSAEFWVLPGRAMSQKRRDDGAKQEPRPHGAMGSRQDQPAPQGINSSSPQYLGDLPAGPAVPWALFSFFPDHTDSLTWLLAGLNLILTSIPALHSG